MSELIVYASELTDTRHLENALRAAGRDYRVERLGMADAAERKRFDALCETAGRRHLPLIRDGERWLGELELLDELGGPPATLSPIARLLGMAALLPIVGGAIAIAAGSTVIAPWLAYAYLLLAFNCGSQWGAALGWPSAPWSFWLRSLGAPLIAWPLTQTDPVLQAYGLALLFGAVLALDRRLDTAGRYPVGYLALRLRFSAVAMLSLVFGALAMDW